MLLGVSLSVGGVDVSSLVFGLFVHRQPLNSGHSRRTRVSIGPRGVSLGLSDSVVSDGIGLRGRDSSVVKPRSGLSGPEVGTRGRGSLLFG